MQADYGILGNALVAFFKGISNFFVGLKIKLYNRKIGKLIKKAEELRRLTGYRYYIIRFKGRIRVLPKQQIKKWIAKGTFKSGTTISEIEEKAIYITKLLPKDKEACI
jgi:hypothetical protein